jgi:hypothetical protein
MDGGIAGIIARPEVMRGFGMNNSPCKEALFGAELTSTSSLLVGSGFSRLSAVVARVGLKDYFGESHALGAAVLSVLPFLGVYGVASGANDGLTAV